MEKPCLAQEVPYLKTDADRESTEKEVSYMLVLLFLRLQYPFVATVKVQNLGTGTFYLPHYGCSCETGISVGCPRGEARGSPSELPISRSPWQDCVYVQHCYLACSVPCLPLPCLYSVCFLSDVCMNYLLNYRSFAFSFLVIKSCW